MNKSARRIRNRPHDVYKAFNAAGELLYVGISINVFNRLREHEKYAGWVRDASTLRVVRYADRRQAMAEEARTIRDEAPLWNVTRERYRAAEEMTVLEQFTMFREEGQWWMYDEG